jgi:predicted nucleic acid-binding protein
MSEQCRRLLERCAKGELTGLLSAMVLAEYCHRRMMQEAQNQGLSSSNPAKALSQKQNLVMQLSQYSREVEDLLSGELTVLAIEGADFKAALELQRKHGLLTNDSLHLAAGLREGASILATADPRFEGVAGLTIFGPDDL